jgi:alpha-1,2-mannosyltransferase
VIAVIGMRRALAGGEPALALSVNAIAALLISPISWSHHWVWAAPALMCLAVTGRRHSWRGEVAAAWAGLALFEVSPIWLLPRSGATGEAGWDWWEQVIGDTYVIFGAVVLVLVLAARFTPPHGRAHAPQTRRDRAVICLCSLILTRLRGRILPAGWLIIRLLTRRPSAPCWPATTYTSRS